MKSLLLRQWSGHLVSKSSTRHLASAVLATDYQRKTVVALKEEAKKRGISQSGLKANLVRRLEEHDRFLASPSLAHKPSRSYASFSQTKNNSLYIKLPDLSLSPEVQEPLVQIPLVPDFWGAANTQERDPTVPQSSNPPSPVMVTTAGDVTHQTQPYHKVYQMGLVEQDTALVDSQESSLQSGTFWTELVDDLGIQWSALPLFHKNGIPNMLERLKVEDRWSAQPLSRDLTEHERTGLIALVGILGGSWLLGGLLASSNASTIGL